MSVLVGGAKGPIIGPGYYTGYRQQRGGAFWSKALSAIMPALKFLGKKAAGTAADVLTDVSEGTDVKEAIKTRAQEQGKKLASSAAQRALKFAQTGRGRKRRSTMRKISGGKKRKRSKTMHGGKRRMIKRKIIGGRRKKQSGGKRKTNKSRRRIPSFLL